jgi:Est1 DNA/RNA binding domain
MSSSRRNTAAPKEPSNTTHITSLQSKARDIEQRLAAALSSNKPNADAQKNINRYRMLLCELYADWILSDPSSAAMHAVGPLWRSCFYGRIGPARTRLQKEQRALEKKKHEGNTETLQASIKQQTESLQVFLSEGITLYEYLCDKLQYELLQEHSSSTTLDSRGASGRVPCLYRLYISLGDLYRYGCQYPPATKSYHIAAVLGPALGHAYNQLAVMDQMQELPQTAVTVYWYARSLAAQVEPFSTASANLVRLFEQNRASLTRQPSISGASSTNSSKSKSSQAANSRHCLALFVDVQYSLFLLSQQQSLDAAAVTTILPPMTECVDAFGVLVLNYSAWGDHLLAKLLTILAFSEYHFAGSNHSLELQCCARVMTLEMGQVLGERVGKILAAKQQQQSSPSSLRVLWPLLLLTEYLLHRPEPPLPENDISSSPVIERYRAARGTFWKRMVHLYNFITESHWETTTSPELVEILEYQEWRGFAPFAPFLPESDAHLLVDGFLSDRATAQLLQLSSSDTTESASLRSSGGGSQSWSLRLATTNHTSSVSMKLLRLLSLRHLLLSSPAVAGHIRPSLQVSSQLLEWIDVVMDPAEKDDGDLVTMEDDDDDGGDVILQPPIDLVYQSNPAGGPALLVPAWSAPATVASPPPSSPWSVSRPAAGMAPPPGFFAAPPGSAASFIDHPCPTSDGSLLLGESMLWLGGPAALQTTNPFVSLSSSDLNSWGDMMMEDHGLSAGLLRSLLMGETTTGAVTITKNPFA